MTLRVLIVGDLSNVPRSELRDMHGAILVGPPDAVKEAGALLYHDVDLVSVKPPEPPPSEVPKWLTWSPAGEIRIDDRDIFSGALIDADCFLRRDGKWAWSARVTPYVVDADKWDGMGDPPTVLGKAKTSGGLGDDEAGARQECGLWIGATVAGLEHHGVVV